MHLDRLGRLRGIAAAALACGALAACSGSFVAPTTANNTVLLQQFATRMAQADSNNDGNRADQYYIIMQMLALGAPVNQIDLKVDGRTLRFSASAGLVVYADSTGAPVDSAYSFAAWRGADADTLAVMQYYMTTLPTNRVGAPGLSLRRVIVPPRSGGVAGTGISASISGIPAGPVAFVAFTVDSSYWISVPDSAAASFQQTSVGSTCTSFTSPVNLNLPTTGLTCRNEHGTLSFSAVVDSASTQASGTHQVTLDPGGMSGVRLLITP